MREKKKGDKHTHRVDHHAFAVRDEGRGHLCSRARSDVYAVHVKLRAATTHTTSARVFAAAPCFPPCVACRCWLFLSRHGRHGSHAKTNEKERKRNRAWIVQRTTEARSERAVEQAVLPIGWHCVQRRGVRPPSAFIVFPRRASSRLGGTRRFSPLSVPRVSTASRADPTPLCTTLLSYPSYLFFLFFHLAIL